jgi:quercetin dioxygenase-like cupin family protein
MQLFRNPVEIGPRTLAPGVTAKIVPGEKLMLSLVTLEPNAAVPPHSHPHEQMGMLVSGPSGGRRGSSPIRGCT